ncbi:MAG: hypothetical protein GXO03_03865 [Aquificae bacterium]|nr:hypothetical protein [Aquificota bacterium]
MERKERIKYLLLAFAVALSLWVAYNFGSRERVEAVRFVELLNADERYAYELKPPFVEISLLVARKFVRSPLLERVRAFVNVKGLKEGTYLLKVVVHSPLPFLISPTGVNPPRVRVVIKKALPESRR